MPGVTPACRAFCRSCANCAAAATMRRTKASSAASATRCASTPCTRRKGWRRPSSGCWMRMRKGNTAKATTCCSIGPRMSSGRRTSRCMPTRHRRGKRRAPLFEQDAAQQAREEMNLLYVAMTRAQQALIVSGCSKGEQREQVKASPSWYDRIAAVVSEQGQSVASAERLLRRRSGLRCQRRSDHARYHSRLANVRPATRCSSSAAHGCTRCCNT